MAPKPGRNDPCPCGSGKKYKQCCQQRATPRSTQAISVQDSLRTALMHHHAGRFSQAEQIYRQVLQRVPKQSDALHLLGALQLSQGNIEAAISMTERSIEFNSSNPESYANLGFALHEQGSLDAALDNYHKAIAMKPDYADAYYNQHAALLDPANLAPAIQSIKKAVELNPFDKDYKFMFGVLLDYSGDTKTAAVYLDVLENGSHLDRARLDAWRYLKSASKTLLPITGSMIQTFRLAMRAALDDGLVLEFGVRHGNSIRQIASLAAQKVYGFDSFKGLPEAWHHEAKGSYSTKGEIPEVPANVELRVGWFEDTIPKFLEEIAGPVRFVNIDCDIYSSTRTVLDQLAPRIVKGSIIIFDEYIGNEYWREDEFKAFQEAVTRYGWTYEYLCFSLFTKQVVVRIC